MKKSDTMQKSKQKTTIMNQLVTDLSTLVSFATVAQNSEAIEQSMEYVNHRLQEIFPFIQRKYRKNGKLSVVWLTQDTLSPDIILNAHMDVVPASESMFHMHKNGDKLIGRGTSDMKFAIASFIFAVKNLHAKVGLSTISLAIMITSDEEQGGFNGVNYLVNEIGYRAKLVIIPDGGDNWHITTMAKGASWVKLTAQGKSAHGSKPWEGISAIDQLIAVLAWLRNQYPNPAQDDFVTTLNIGVIEGGTTANQVAESASAVIDIRYTPDLTCDDILAAIKSQFPDLVIERVLDKPAFVVDKNNSYINQWTKLLRQHRIIPNEQDLFMKDTGSADHHYFSQHGIPVLISKPVGGLIHTEQEWLSKRAFVQYSSLLTEYLLNLARTLPQKQRTSL